jgi:hypothetical protein
VRRRIIPGKQIAQDQQNHGSDPGASLTVFQIVTQDEYNMETVSNVLRMEDSKVQMKLSELTEKRTAKLCFWRKEKEKTNQGDRAVSDIS